MANRGSLIAAAVLMAACASKKPAPKPAAAPAPAPKVAAAPAVQSLEQYLQDAKAAADANDKERARDIYRAAARAYPSSKEPWLKLAEDYFESANYGQAILAAQEVVQRDPDDNVGTSILAVSGLRVSVAALSTLRGQEGRLTGGTRNEAQSLARTLRESLGEAELVPAPAAPPHNAVSQSAAATPPAAAASRPAPPQRPRPQPAPVRRPATAAPAAAPAPAGDPFDILKK